MSASVRPLIRALLRNRTGAILVALQVAIALAVMVNALYIVRYRLSEIDRPTGADISDLFAIDSAGFTPRFRLRSSISADLAYLRAMPGVIAASPANSVPFDGIESTDVWLEPGQHGEEFRVFYFRMDGEGVKTLGAHLLAGRDFRPDEIRPPQTSKDLDETVPALIVSRALAQEIFHGRSAVGSTVYFANGTPAIIVGITNDMRLGNGGGPSKNELAIFPSLPGPRDVFYLVRTVPGRRDEIMRSAEEHLAASNTDRVIRWSHPVEQFKESFDAENRNMAIFLSAVTAVMLAVASLGIYGLATFNVSSRTKEIGTLRAVGARRRDIVAHFMIENAIILAAGVLMGCALALAVGYWLSLQYGLPRLDLYYLMGGMLALCAIGQLAAWQPARRAASIPPSVATRTV